MPENTRPVASNYNPNYNNQNPASAPQSPYPNIYPQIPSGNTQYPQNPYPGQYPQNPGAPQGYPGQYPGYQQPYPQQPYPNQPYPNQPQQFPNQNPYGGANPFGNQFPNYRNIPTTTEPSLWNQFLYNKDRGYGFRNAATTQLNTIALTILTLFASTFLGNAFLLRRP